MSCYLYGERRRQAREHLYEAMVRDGSWRKASEWLDAYRDLPGAPDALVWTSQVDGLLRELHTTQRIERKQRARNTTRFWRAAPLPPIPDTFPSDWTREPVLA